MKTSTNSRQDRISFVDAMKGLAIILMIVNHVPLEGLQWFRFIQVFHMPLFFLLSGYLYKQRPLSGVVSRNFKKVLLPYILSCVIIFLGKVFLYNDKCWWLSVLWGNSKSLEFLDTSLAVGPLWFLTAFFWAMITVNILERFSNKLSLLLLFVLFSLSIIQARIMGNLLPFGLTTGIGGAVFVYAGIHLKKHPEFFVNKRYLYAGLFIWLLCVLTGRLAMSWHVYGLFVLQIIGGIYGTYICYKFVNSFKEDSLITKCLCYIGANTLSILCIHSIDRVLLVSETLSKIIVGNDDKIVMIYQVDLVLKFLFVLIVFICFKYIPFINKIFQIK